MKFENAFAVSAPIEEVWDALLDLERVAPCMPGAEVLERTGENAYRVGIRVRLGPMSMMYRGEVEIVERDDEAREAVMRARAREARGQGTADAHVRMALAGEDGGTRATFDTDLQLRGRVASMGGGVVEDVSAKLVESFADNLAAMLEPQPEAAAASPEEGPAAGPPPRAAPGPAPASLPLGDLAAQVAAARLRNPRARAAALLLIAVVLLAIGFAAGRRRD
jgi:uncharacterized protein